MKTLIVAIAVFCWRMSFLMTVQHVQSSEGCSRMSMSLIIIWLLYCRIEDCRLATSYWPSMVRAWLVLHKKRKFFYQLLRQ